MLQFLAIGALSSGLSSALTTPMDVVKTRLATGVLPPGSGVVSSMIAIAKQDGVKGLFAGERMSVMNFELVVCIALPSSVLNST